MGHLLEIKQTRRYNHAFFARCLVVSTGFSYTVTVLSYACLLYRLSW